MQRTHSQELQRVEETKLLDKLVADLPNFDSSQDLIFEVKAKFGQGCPEKIELCEAFA